MVLKKETNIHFLQSNTKDQQILIPFNIHKIYTNEMDWVLLKLSIPKKLREFLDKNKRINNISYSEYINQAIKDKYQSKIIYQKVLTNKVLTQEDKDHMQKVIDQS